MVLGSFVWMALACAIPASLRQACPSTRQRSRSNPARPYISRLMTLSRLTWPSTWPLLHGSVSAARTASSSRRSPAANGASLRLAQPAVERNLVLDHRHEAADEIDGGGDDGGALQQRGNEPAVGGVQRVGLSGQQANRPARRGRFGGLGCRRLASHVGRRGGRILPPAPGRPRPHDAPLTGKTRRLQGAPQG